MPEQRFDFLEVGQGEAEPRADQIPIQIEKKIVPEDQYLSYFDLLSLQPARPVLRSLAHRLLLKYQCIPLAVILRDIKFRIPRHFDRAYHVEWPNQSPFILYIALCDPYNAHTLRIVQNATGYTVYAIPIKVETFDRFMGNDYQQIVSADFK